jgi:hypothetical protein
MLNDFRIRVRALFRRDAVEDDLADENFAFTWSGSSRS